MHPPSLHPCYGFDADAMCLLSFIHQVGCCHLAPDLLQVRAETLTLTKNAGDPKSASAPCTQQGSGTLRQPPDQLLYFHHLIPCLSASSDKNKQNLKSPPGSKIPTFLTMTGFAFVPYAVADSNLPSPLPGAAKHLHTQEHPAAHHRNQPGFIIQL